MPRRSEPFPPAPSPDPAAGWSQTRPCRWCRSWSLSVPREFPSHDNHDSPASCPRMEGHGRRVPDIGRTVRVGVRGCSLGAGQDDGGLSIYRHIQVERSLLHRIGAVQYDNALHLMRHLAHARRQIEPDFGPHMLAGNVGKVFHRGVRQPCQTRNSGQKVQARHGRHLPTGDRIQPHGDGSTSGNDVQAWLGCHSLVGWRNRP
jgi:hypothetical protein